MRTLRAIYNLGFSSHSTVVTAMLPVLKKCMLQDFLLFTAEVAMYNVEEVCRFGTKSKQQ